jgi:hypothetical protein
MNFLKKTANKISNGIELESLKYERGNLKNQIRRLQAKIESYNQTLELKSQLQMLIDVLTHNVETPIILAGARANTSSEKRQQTDGDSDDGVPDEEDLDSFDNIQKKSYTIVKSSHDEIKTIIEKLNIILVPGVDKHNAEIDKKKQRIEEINKKLSALRAKN